MKATLPLTALLAALLLAAPAAPATPAPAAPAPQLPGDEFYLPGDPELLPSPACTGHLWGAVRSYLCLLSQGKNAEHARRVAFDTARRFPLEVNDLVRFHNGSCHTPLSMAVQAQDAELVHLLLLLKALPVPPQPGMSWADVTPLPNVPRNEVLYTRLPDTPCHHDLVTTLLNNQHTQEKASRSLAPGTKPADPQAELTAAVDHLYLCEPGEPPFRLVGDPMRLASPDRVLLRVQPVSRVVEFPEEFNGYASVTTTARLVKALKGKAPECATITWTIAAEPPIKDSEGEHICPADEPPVFLMLYTQRIEKAVAEGNNLNFGVVDFDICRYGEKWQADYDRVFADFPELLETTPATEEELAAAYAILDANPAIVRATITDFHTEIDHQASQLRVTYAARLRDPLKGAIIRGFLYDWSPFFYTRTFPITDESLRLHEACQGSQRGREEAIPVILMLDPATRRVQQAYDAENDTALLRALNEAIYAPRAELSTWPRSGAYLGRKRSASPLCHKIR